MCNGWFYFLYIKAYLLFAAKGVLVHWFYPECTFVHTCTCFLKNIISFILCVFVSGWVFIYLWFFLFPFSFFFLPLFLFFFWCALNVNFHVHVVQNAIVTGQYLHTVSVLLHVVHFNSKQEYVSLNPQRTNNVIVKIGYRATVVTSVLYMYMYMYM